MVFTLASLWCGLSGDVETLIVARVFQGFGAALMTPQTMAVITRIFPPDRRGAAMGIWGATAGVATLVGPILGGVLVDGLGWEWIFFINVPVGLIGFFLALRYVPALSTHPHKFDIPGVLLSAVGLFLLVFGIQEGETYDWGTIAGPITVWGLIISGIAVLVVFVVWQKMNKGEPLLPLSLFKDRNFSLANIGITTVGLHGDGLHAAADLLLPDGPGPDAHPVGADDGADGADLRRTGPGGGQDHRPGQPEVHHRDRPGPDVRGAVLERPPDAPGHAASWLFLLPSAVLGFANAGIWAPLSSTATRNLPPRQAGAGSGVYNTTRQIGAVLGSAAIAVLIQARLAAELPAAPGGSGEAGPMSFAGALAGGPARGILDGDGPVHPAARSGHPARRGGGAVLRQAPAGAGLGHTRLAAGIVSRRQGRRGCRGALPLRRDLRHDQRAAGSAQQHTGLDAAGGEAQAPGDGQGALVADIGAPLQGQARGERLMGRDGGCQ